jgi:hypothetical protein
VIKMPLLGQPQVAKAAGDSRGQSPLKSVAIGRPAEAGYSRGVQPSKYHKAGSRRG